MEKKSKFTGMANTALLASVLAFPGCDLAKPKNKEINTPQAEPVAEVVDAPRPPPPTVTPPRQTQAQNSPVPTTSHQTTMQQPTPPRQSSGFTRSYTTSSPANPAERRALIQAERQAALLGPMPAELP
jgi:hypothetical protein